MSNLRWLDAVTIIAYMAATAYVERVVARANGRTMVYAGIGDARPDEVTAGNHFFQAGADVVVCRPRVSFPAENLLPWYRSLLSRFHG